MPYEITINLIIWTYGTVLTVPPVTSPQAIDQQAEWTCVNMDMVYTLSMLTQAYSLQVYFSFSRVIVTANHIVTSGTLKSVPYEI